MLDTGRPLEVELGPGLLGRIFDGTQRPLEVLARAGDDPFGRPLLPRGVDVPALDRERRWTFEPRVAEGAAVAPGDVLGVVAETAALEHRVLVPPHLGGRRDGDPLRAQRGWRTRSRGSTIGRSRC